MNSEERKIYDNIIKELQKDKKELKEKIIRLEKQITEKNRLNASFAVQCRQERIDNVEGQIKGLSK